ncbi:MAG: hypothetical protein HYT87_17530 [Nitrospirae bacterium]|nr:hypothetical protein [Nitrospirota bacterium]
MEGQIVRPWRVSGFAWALLLASLTILLVSSCSNKKKKSSHHIPDDSIEVIVGIPLTPEQAALLEGVRAGVRAGVRTIATDGIRAETEQGVRAGTEQGVRAGQQDGVRAVVEDGLAADILWNDQVVAEGVRAGVRTGIRAGVRTGVRAAIGGGKGLPGAPPRRSGEWSVMSDAQDNAAGTAAPDDSRFTNHGARTADRTRSARDGCGGCVKRQAQDALALGMEITFYLPIALASDGLYTLTTRVRPATDATTTLIEVQTTVKLRVQGSGVGDQQGGPDSGLTPDPGALTPAFEIEIEETPIALNDVVLPDVDGDGVSTLVELAVIAKEAGIQQALQVAQDPAQKPTEEQAQAVSASFAQNLQKELADQGVKTLVEVKPVDLTPPDTALSAVSGALPVASGASIKSGEQITLTLTCNENFCAFRCSLDGASFAPCASPLTPDPRTLSPGDHTLRVQAADAIGNKDLTPAEIKFTVLPAIVCGNKVCEAGETEASCPADCDKTPPDTSLVGAGLPALLTNQTSATFQFVGTDSNPSAPVSFQCSLDSAAFSSCVSPVTLSTVEGSHTFSVAAVDKTGNKDPTPVTFTWTVDLTPPDTSITSKPTDPTNSTTASFTFTSPESTARFECKLDSAAYAACSSPFTAPTSLAEGSHSFSTRAVDAAGNADATPASHTWTVDLTAPDTSITAQPPNPTNTTSASFSFSAPDSGATFECEIDSGGYSACASPKVYSGLMAGSRTFQVRSKDAAGNTDASPASTAWTIDIGAPVAGTVTPANTATATHVDGSFDLSAAFSDSGSSITSCQYCKSTDGACDTEWAAAAFSSGTCSKTAIACANGETLTLNMAATDAAGNTGGGVAVTRTCDTAAPATGTVNDGTGADVSSQSSTTTMNVNWSGFSDAGSGLQRYDYNLSTTTACAGNIVATTDVALVTSKTTTSLSLVASTTYYNCVRAVDTLGQIAAWTASNGVTVVVDTTPPTFSGASSAASASATRINLTWTAATDAVSASAAIIYRICQSTTTGTCQTTFTTTYTTAAGAVSYGVDSLTTGTTYYFVVRAVDEAGNVETNTVQVSAAPVAPPTCPAGSWAEVQRKPTGMTLYGTHFVNNLTGYSVGDRGMILKTTDGGATWAVTCGASGTINRLYAVHFPVDATTGYAVGNTGTILKTTDSGAIWTAQTSGVTNNLYGVHFPVDATTGYAVGSSGTILKTTNSGATWTAQTSGTTNFLEGVHFPVDATTGYAIGGSGTILKTTNSGATWTAQTSGTTMPIYSVHFPVDATTGYAVTLSTSCGWACTNPSKVLKTTDGGTNWSAQDSPNTTTDFYTVRFVGGTTTGYIAGTGGKIYKTTDSGATWAAQTSGTTSDLWSANFPVDATTGYIVGVDGTALKTTNGGTSWADQTAGTGKILYAVHFPVSATGYAVGASGTIIKTTDSGGTWAAQSSGITTDLYDMHFPVDTTTGWAVGASGKVLKTTDGGTGWTDQSPAISNTLYGVHFLDTTAGWFVGSSGALYKTTNGGASWVSKSSGTSNQLNAIQFATSTSAFAVGVSGTIIRTTNSGNVWQTQTSGTTNLLRAIHFPVDATTGYVVGDSGTILKTSDGGTAWSSQTSGTTSAIYGVYFINANTGYVVGASGTILKTTDGGGNWISQTSGTTVLLRGVQFPGNGSTGYAVGESGTVLKTTTGGQ